MKKMTPRTEFLPFHESPAAFIWFYANLLILAVEIILPLMLFIKTKQWGWLLFFAAPLISWIIGSEGLMIRYWPLYPHRIIHETSVMVIVDVNWWGIMTSMGLILLWLQGKGRIGNF